MQSNPLPNFDRRITSIDDRAIYRTLQESVMNGTCDSKQLITACLEGRITKEQRNTLGFLLAQKLEKEIVTDDTTDILNRRILELELDRAIEDLNSEKEPNKLEEKTKIPGPAIMVIYLDIDNMKVLNDEHSHSVGTEAIITVANRLKEVTKKRDRLFHVHGDEFVAILLINDGNPRNLEAIFKRIEHQINNNLSVSDANTDIPFRVSMGYEVLNKGDTRTAKELIKEADAKMYLEKNRKTA